MAKLTAPLLSLDARGKFGGALTFIGWKGIKCVRQLVIPANPQTAAQTAQRGKMANCVSSWHVEAGDDRDAWGLWAPFEAKPMSGFNAFTKAGIPLLAADADAHVTNGVALTPGDTVLDIEAVLIKLSDQSAVASDANLTVLHGTSARNLGTSVALPWDAGDSDYTVQLTSLVNGVPIFLRIYDTNNAAYVSGLFTATPTA